MKRKRFAPEKIIHMLQEAEVRLWRVPAPQVVLYV
jgi:hypothetical protein